MHASGMFNKTQLACLQRSLGSILRRGGSLIRLFFLSFHVPQLKAHPPEMGDVRLQSWLSSRGIAKGTHTICPAAPTRLRESNAAL
jgi:hypothetical protein